MNSVEIIDRVASRIAAGRTPLYMAVHVLRVLEILGSSPGVGRLGVARLLGLGEGVARTLVKHLRIEGLLEVSKEGMRLSDKGMKILSDIRSHMKSMEFPETEITVGSHNHAVLVKGG
ncbi:hypothetical protein KEJ34_06670, partial [Candidatus Bathyarchaeota archaeon]|nr:hypothetical protein [Candidatus Bathyarchaeota archaeon]